MAAVIFNGIYAITQRHVEGPRFTLDSADEGAAVAILPFDGIAGKQEWEVEVKSDNNVTIKNLKHGTYLSFSDAPHNNETVTGQEAPREWQLRPTSETLIFNVVVPGGPVDGKELALDLSLFRIFPPRISLRSWEAIDLEQGWYFKAR